MNYTLNCDLLFAYMKSEISGAKIRNQWSMPEGVWWSTSAKCEDTGIDFGSRQAPVHLTTVLELYLSLYLNYDSCLCIRS
jgi:hypothetical protein